MNEYRILCTGNPNYPGIPRAIRTHFPNTTFISKSTGYDLITVDGQAKFKSIIKNYNVFVNVAQLSNGSQESLLKIAHAAGMQGHVFNIGSIAEYNRWKWYDANYTAEKRSLREASLDLCTEFFKTTHIIVGGFQDATSDNPKRMDPIEIVNAMQYILNSTINIPIIGIEKINDIEMQEQLKDQHGKLQTT
jgi:hypothetical protein